MKNLVFLLFALWLWPSGIVAQDNCSCGCEMHASEIPASLLRQAIKQHLYFELHEGLSEGLPVWHYRTIVQREGPPAFSIGLWQVADSSGVTIASADLMDWKALPTVPADSVVRLIDLSLADFEELCQLIQRMAARRASLTGGPFQNSILYVFNERLVVEATSNAAILWIDRKTPHPVSYRQAEAWLKLVPQWLTKLEP